jgi:hypothetical protein
MTSLNMLLVGVCAVLGFGIIWNLMGSSKKD